MNTLDYPCYGIRVEKTRWAFRTAASILDKVAVFLALYLGLSEADSATFRTVWYIKGKPEKGLRREFASLANWPLRGLFWLSKDFYHTAICGEDLDPEAINLRAIRNGLEHRYVKVLEFATADDKNNPLRDQHAVMIGRNEFQEKALRYLGHAREALIYLALGIHANEVRRPAEKIAGPTFLPNIDDEWKT